MDEDVKDDDKDEAVVKIMHAPNLLDDLDLDDYAEHLASVKNKPNMIHLLKFIVDELTLPFKDPRKINSELDDEELFYKLCKETKMVFKKHSMVNVKVIKVL